VIAVPLARLLPRSPAQRVRAAGHALLAWWELAVRRTAHAIALAAPILILGGLVFAIGIAVTSGRPRAQPIVAPPPPPPLELCGEPGAVSAPRVLRELCDRAPVRPLAR
jgi:hypothetical protein